MKKFQVILTDHAIRDLDAISKKIREKIYKDLVLLQSTPFSFESRIKRLKGFKPPVYRLRSGDFRILYRIQDKTVTILRVIDRKLLERVIKRLKL